MIDQGVYYVTAYIRVEKGCGRDKKNNKKAALHRWTQGTNISLLAFDTHLSPT